MDATLAGHTDHSEPNRRAPLISISLGQSAIFLIGGRTKSEKSPEAVLLRSGDVAVMTTSARDCFHAVPKILATDEQKRLVSFIINLFPMFYIFTLLILVHILQ